MRDGINLLNTLNPLDTEIEKEWSKVAKRRLEELRSGCVKPIPGDKVFAEIMERLRNDFFISSPMKGVFPKRMRKNA